MGDESAIAEENPQIPPENVARMEFVELFRLGNPNLVGLKDHSWVVAFDALTEAAKLLCPDATHIYTYWEKDNCCYLIMGKLVGNTDGYYVTKEMKANVNGKFTKSPDERLLLPGNYNYIVMMLMDVIGKQWREYHALKKQIREIVK